MCWVGNIQNRKIAKEDIRVFKVCKLTFDGHIVPYFNSLCGMISYKEGETYYDSFMISSLDVSSIEISQGLHSYAISKLNDSESIEAYSTHSFDSFAVIASGQIYCNPRARIVLCTIPKDTVYYINKNDEIVSHCLRVDKIINSRVTYDNIEEINKILNKWNS